jgi:hypothetical protein
LENERLAFAEGWRGQDGIRFCEGVATTQHRGSFDLEGGLDTEHARACLARMPDESRPKTKRESQQFTGKVIAALYESNLRMELSGRALIGAELGATLGVRDIDDSAPKSYRYELGGPPELLATLTP